MKGRGHVRIPRRSPQGGPGPRGASADSRAGGRAGVPWAVPAEPPMSSQLHGCPCELRDWQSPAESGQAARRGAPPSPLPLPLASTCPAAAGPSAPGWDPTCLMQWEGSSRPTRPSRPVFGLAFQTVGRRAEGFLFPLGHRLFGFGRASPTRAPARRSHLQLAPSTRPHTPPPLQALPPSSRGDSVSLCPFGPRPSLTRTIS